MHPRLKHALPLITALGVWGIVLGLRLFAANYLHGVDGYYHLGISRLMAEQGLLLESFPYATESIWSERWFDKEWLFHVYLVPFFLTLGPVIGTQLATLLLSLGIVGAFWYACRRLRIEQPLWLLLALPFIAHLSLLNRLVQPRPHLVSIIIVFVAIGAMVARRRLLLAIVSFLYALSYTGHWQLLGLVFLYDALYAFFTADGQRRKTLCRELPLLVPTAIGMLMGEIVHPQFPDNILGLYIQNVQVLLQYWQGSESEFLVQMRPAEMRAYALGPFLQNFWPLLLGLAAMAAWAIRHRQRLDRSIIYLAICTAGYLFMTWRSKRFAEYFVAVAVIFLGLCWQRFELGRKLHWRGLKGLTALLATIAIVLTLVTVGREIAHDLSPRYRPLNRPPFQAAGQWLQDHAQPDDIVFVTSWSDNPMLWFSAPEQRFLVFLDPYFMYSKSPERFDLWHRTRLGAVDDPATVIRDTFGASYVFSRRDHNFALLFQALEATPGVEIIFNGSYLLYRLPPADAE